MGYPENLQRLCDQRGVHQADLAARLGLSRSTLSRVLRGVQEPKLTLAFALARELGVTLDALMEEPLVGTDERRTVRLDDEEWTILAIVRRLGTDAALDRLLAVDRPAFAEADADPDEVPRKG